MKRNNNLDFFRGFAILWIILIHTCFHSGDAYVPVIVKTMSLIIDVPVFLFLAGYTFHYTNSFEKNIKGLLKIYIYYLVFTVIFFIITGIVSRDQITVPNVINALFFKYSQDLPLPSFRYSMWFLPMFFLVSSIGSLFISHCKLNRNHVILTFILYGVFTYYLKDKTLSMIFLYLFLYCLGYYCHDHKLSFKKFIFYFLIIIGLNVVFKYFGPYGFKKIQTAKFDFDIVYLVYSMISILIIWFINTRVEFHNRFITLIGRNSFILYLCQGFSSSILYELAPKIHIHWVPKLITAFAFNIVCSLILFFIFYKIFEKLKQPIQNLLSSE